MAYPRQLTLSEDAKLELIIHLDQELINHYAERDDYIQQLKDWQRDYWVKPATKQRTFPFTGASTIIIPLTAIALEAVHARAWLTLFAIKPFVSVKSRVKQLVDSEHSFENWLDYFTIEHMKIEKPLTSAILELEKYGTGIGKSGYRRITKKAVRPVGDTDIEEEFTVVQQDGPTTETTPNANFLMPFYADDPQTAPWVGEEHTSSMTEIELFEQSELFIEGVKDELRGFFQGTSAGQEDQFRQAQQELEAKDPTIIGTLTDFSGPVTWQEIWLSFDVDGDGEKEEIQVLYHRQAKLILSIRYNWYDDLRRPYRFGNYIPIEHRWNGIGICKQNDQFQRGVTTIARQRLDNATLANMRMFKVHKLSGYGPKEPVFPGKMWFLDDMNHIEPMQIGEIYPSSFANEQSLQLYSQQRTGATEPILGLGQVGTPGTATSDLARIQEGKQKFDFVFRNMRVFVSELVRDIVLNTMQFGTKNSRYFDLVEGGQQVRDILFGTDRDLVRDGILFEISAVGQQRNRLLDRNQWQEIAVILQKYFTGMIQLAELTDPKLIPIIGRKGMLAITEVLKQVLESFDVRDRDRIVVTEIEEILRNAGGTAEGQPGALPLPGGNGGAAGDVQTPGVADLLASVARLGAGGS